MGERLGEQFRAALLEQLRPGGIARQALLYLLLYGGLQPVVGHGAEQGLAEGGHGGGGVGQLLCPPYPLGGGGYKEAVAVGQQSELALCLGQQRPQLVQAVHYLGLCAHGGVGHLQPLQGVYGRVARDVEHGSQLPQGGLGFRYPLGGGLLQEEGVHDEVVVSIDRQVARYHVVEGEAAVLPAVQALDMGDELLALLEKSLRLVGVFGRRLETRHVERLLQLLQQVSLRHLVGVHLEAERIEADAGQAFLHHLEGRHLLGHEEHTAVVVERIGYHVGDGLALACARRSVEDEAASLAALYHRLEL